MIISFIIFPFLPNMYTEQLYSPTLTCHFPLIIHFLGQFNPDSLPALIPPISFLSPIVFQSNPYFI